MENKGFLLIGGIGIGKTVLIKSLVQQLDAEVTFAVVTDPRFQLIDFYKIDSNIINTFTTYHCLLCYQKFVSQVYA